MKNLISFVFTFLFVFVSNSQTYEMYSDVWEYVSKDSKMIVPKGGGSFSFPSEEMIGKIDTNKINSYMLESFNKFRSEYGKSPVIEDKDLTKKCKSYAKFLISLLDLKVTWRCCYVKQQTNMVLVYTSQLILL